MSYPPIPPSSSVKSCVYAAGALWLEAYLSFCTALQCSVVVSCGVYAWNTLDLNSLPLFFPHKMYLESPVL
ncbi:hypothetical protein L873DRAFT_1325760 [Choiromyces venosus 120613-1]|uniref:Uncharacterized protein n=1 Tax=Choiromyces venosus 120613-1 TaxID=1336337 RepID=A0A3N4JAU3_9PEZI|nr:hypothetical protein L873DRAFT_1325760 [Choiromyces venosus 120613-1]